MACYAYSVLTRWFSSVYSGAGSRTSSDLMSKQVVIASSVTPSELNDSSQLPDTTYDLPEIVQPTTRKGGDTDKVIILPVETCNFIMGYAQSAFVSTRSIDDMEDALICDGWLHLDKEPGKLYSVQTKGGRNSDSAWRNHHENNAPLLQNIFC